MHFLFLNCSNSPNEQLWYFTLWWTWRRLRLQFQRNTYKTTNLSASGSSSQWSKVIDSWIFRVIAQNEVIMLNSKNYFKTLNFQRMRGHLGSSKINQCSRLEENTLYKYIRIHIHSVIHSNIHMRDQHYFVEYLWWFFVSYFCVSVYCYLVNARAPC